MWRQKEQLLTKPGEHKIYIQSRKGFVKLALQHGASLVPFYTYGENELYSVSRVGLGFRQWLQAKLSIALPLMWGPVWYCPLFPHRTPLAMEIGAPIPVKAQGIDNASRLSAPRTVHLFFQFENVPNQQLWCLILTLMSYISALSPKRCACLSAPKSLMVWRKKPSCWFCNAEHSTVRTGYLFICIF